MGMKLLFLIGASAAGKMTVGQELMKITDLRLFHNHMTIEPVIEIFGHYSGRVVTRLREVIFEEFAASDHYGMIFTMIWDFDAPEDWAYVAHVREIFEKYGAEVYCAELIADPEVRRARNVSENRLRNKASKRDLALSERLFRDAEENHRCVSREGEVPFEHYLRIDNTALTPAEAARRIKEAFRL